MKDLSESEVATIAEFDRRPAVAYVEVDRFCDGCGYNLLTQPVRREGHTGLLMCRCPECGRFHAARDAVTAGRVWLQRLGTLLLLGWVLTVLAFGIGLGAAQVGVMIGTLEELTRYRQQQIAMLQQIPTVPQVPTVQRTQTPAGTTVTITQPPPQRTTTVWQRQIRDNVPYYREFITLMNGISLAIGFTLAGLAVVTFHHWRRWGYVVLVTLVSVAGGVLVWAIWRFEAPHLADWSVSYILSESGAYLAGGFAGVLLGRPLARLIVTLILPPKIRQVLAFLWLADGKEPPRRGARSASEGACE